MSSQSAPAPPPLPEPNVRPVSELTARRLLKAVRYVGGVLLALVLVLASFHPWTQKVVGDVMAVLPLLLLVLIFVYVINPLVEFILHQVRKLPGSHYFSYTKSLIVTYLLILALIIALVAIIAPRLVEEVQILSDNFPYITQKAIGVIDRVRHQYFESLHLEVQERITHALEQMTSLAGTFVGGALQYAGTISSAVVWIAVALVMVPFISFYILSDGPRLFKFWLDLLPPARRPGARVVVSQIHQAMQSFIKGQAILCLVVGAMTTVLLAFVMPKYCIVLGLIAGITEAIPIVGPILGAIPAVILALAIPEEGGLTLALVVVVIYVFIQQIENNFLVPKIMGDTLGLHPLSLMLGMMIFSNIFGFWGTVLASPIVATVKIIVLHFLKPQLLEPSSAPHSAPKDSSQAPSPTPQSEISPASSKEEAEAKATSQLSSSEPRI